jgi:hypothetical protein
MNKYIILFLSSLSFLFSPSVLAESFNDNYLQFNDNYVQIEYSASDYKISSQNENNIFYDVSNKENATDLRGSIDIGYNYSLLGGYSRETGSWNDTVYETAISDVVLHVNPRTSTYTKLLIGLGKNYDLNTNTQLTTSLSAVTLKSKTTKQEWPVDDGTTVVSSSSLYYDYSIGVRTIRDLHVFTKFSDVELSAKYSRVGKSGSKANKYELEAVKHIRNNFAIGGRIVSQSPTDFVKDTYSKTGIFLRRVF